MFVVREAFSVKDRSFQYAKMASAIRHLHHREDEDKKQGKYKPNFYEVFDESNKKIVYPC